MKKFYRQLGILTIAAGMLANNQVANAINENPQITGIKLEKGKNALQLRLETNNKQQLPSIVAANEDGGVIASLIDAELNLAGKKSFRQEKPYPGIASIEVKSAPKGGVNIIVQNENGSIVEETVERKADALILNLAPAKDTNKTKGNEKYSFKKLIAQNPTIPQTPEEVKSPVNPQPFTQNPNQDVLIPNPTIVIDGEAKTQEVPQYIPRAVAPPVGDMAVSNLNTSFDRIDLGTTAPIRRLVLRDAPVREVLGTLSRYAGLNLVFTGEGQATPNVSTNISLDIENESVQDVFNYVLMMSGMQASRKGNTIFVGTQLPPQARNLITRTIRLNQVKVSNAAAFLATQGAEATQVFTPTKDITDPQTGKVIGTRSEPSTIVPLTIAQNPNSKGALLLSGLSLATDERLNSITLIGEPQKIQLATTLLTQLDARKRQVAINVKVIDINLLNTERANASFSFGVGDTFVVQDQGTAGIRFGNETPIGIGGLGVSGNVTTPGTVTDLLAFPKNFLALLESQVTSGNAKVLTDPTLVVQEGQKATVKLTQEIVKSIETSIDGTSGARTVTPVIGEAGLTLTVDVDKVDDNGFVSLSVSPTVSSVGSTQIFDSGEGAENVLSLLNKRELTSGAIRLRDGQTLILSGIIQDSERATVSKIPILGDLPLIGALFRSTNNTNQRAEVVVLVTPQVMEDSPASEWGYDYKVSPEAQKLLQQQGVTVPGN